MAPRRRTLPGERTGVMDYQEVAVATMTWARASRGGASAARVSALAGGLRRPPVSSPTEGRAGRP